MKVKEFLMKFFEENLSKTRVFLGCTGEAVKRSFTTGARVSGAEFHSLGSRKIQESVWGTILLYPVFAEVYE
ncbi:MAG: hypothetical protein J1F64_00320 [Oscillospiraceae bacterium]|nr:hypothetical protein [Oscillospiraceae bacterium]